MSAAATIEELVPLAQSGLAALASLLEKMTGAKPAATPAPAAGSTPAGSSSSSSSSANVSITGGVVTDVSAVAESITAGEKLALFVTQAKNTPAMVTAAEKQAHQDWVDKFDAALEAGDTATVRKMISGL